MANFKREAWHLNGRQVAEWLGVSPKTVSQRDYPRASEPSGREAVYDVREVLRIDAARGLVLVEDGEAIDHDAEKARLTKARRIAQELDNAETEKRLRPLEEVESAIIQTLSPVAAMLDALPMAIKRDCPELSAYGVERIERTIATARNTLADDIENSAA